MKLEDIYKEAQEEQKKISEYAFYKCLKKRLTDDIGKSKGKWWTYKVICQENASLDVAGVSIATAALVVAYMALIVGIIEYGKISEICLICLVLIAVAITGTVYWVWSKKRKKYSQILLILDEIEGDMIED